MTAYQSVLVQEQEEAVASDTSHEISTPVWITNTTLIWQNRRALGRMAVASFVVALAIAFLLPKRYESSARIMPQGNSMGGIAMLAALAGHGDAGLSGLGALAGGLLGGGGNTALFIELLHSGTVTGHLIDRFDLMHVYHKRYHIDAAKTLARRTTIVDDKKSGVITLTVTDSDPTRARDMAQGYLDELNSLVNTTNTSSAHQERLFIEKRLQLVKTDLATAQQRLSDFSSTHGTIDIKEQTRAVVEGAARLQAQLIIEQSGLQSLRKTYGDDNIRVRSTEARIAYLQGEIAKIGGSSKELSSDGDAMTPQDSTNKQDEELYPPLRQLPRLAVPYADLYRQVRVQEAVYELLIQQYERARIQEAKDVPVVSIIDHPGIPEKKSFPPRLLLAILLMVIATASHAALLITRQRWGNIPSGDPTKLLLVEVATDIRNLASGWKMRIHKAGPPE
jgi:capsule polysaccharide export protein KpsE/RkpR